MAGEGAALFRTAAPDADGANRKDGEDGIELAGCLEAAAENGDTLGVGASEPFGGQAGGGPGADLAEPIGVHKGEGFGCFGVVKEENEPGTVFGVGRVDFGAEVGAVGTGHLMENCSRGQGKPAARLGLGLAEAEVAEGVGQ